MIRKAQIHEIEKKLPDEEYMMGGMEGSVCDDRHKLPRDPHTLREISKRRGFIFNTRYSCYHHSEELTTCESLVVRASQFPSLLSFSKEKKLLAHSKCSMVLLVLVHTLVTPLIRFIESTPS